ncbi:MAG: hypothetical protein J6L75_05955 [Alistipes sp.]|nr:hypothetical protein [Alistipes sp.]
MIKRIIGVLATLAIIALVVFTALGSGTYKSMLPEEWFARAAAESAEVVADEDDASAEIDSLSLEADSLTVEVVE